MNFTDIIVGFFGLMGSVVVAYLAYKRGVRADDAVDENTKISHIYEGYGSLIKILQDDNAELRQRLAKAEERIEFLLEKLGNKA